MIRRSCSTLFACVVVALTVLAAACGGTSENGGDTSASTAATEATSTDATSSAAAAESGDVPADWVPTTPAPSGEIDSFSWALFYEPASLDWIKAAAVAENEVVANLCENLLRLKPDLTFEPGLAESYVSPDPTTWVLTIRQGVKFWNGNELTADDVVFSLSRNLDPSSFVYGSFVNVASIEKTGPWEVTVKLKKPDALFIQALSTNAGGVGEQAYLEEKGDTYGTPDGGVMCTGPFAFEKWTKGESITLVRNKNYWNDDYRAHAGSVTFRFINDDATRMSALLSGEIDGTHWVSAESVEQLRSSGPGTLTLGWSTLVDQLAVTEKEGPLQDPRIRQALSLVIDRAAINETIFASTAIPSRALAGPVSWTYATAEYKAAYEALTPLAVNVDEAKRLVEEAGSPTETIVMSLAANLQAGVRMGTIIQDAAREIGLKIELNAIPSSQFVNLFFDPEARASTDTFLFFNYAQVPDPLEVYDSAGQPTSAYNYAGYDNPIVTEALTKARETYDPDERARYVIEAQAEFMKDLPTIPLVNIAVTMFQNERITGATASQAYFFEPWAAHVGAS